ncbi:hypothetical protein OG943_10675 [Amycolatopsis sp. NBC_00345]
MTSPAQIRQWPRTDAMAGLFLTWLQPRLEGELARKPTTAGRSAGRDR